MKRSYLMSTATTRLTSEPNAAYDAGLQLSVVPGGGRMPLVIVHETVQAL